MSVREEPVPLPIENRYRDGFVYRHITVTKFGLWLRWALVNIFTISNNDPYMTWERAKQLAKEGRLRSQQYAGACFYPLWTNIYYLQ